LAQIPIPIAEPTTLKQILESEEVKASPDESWDSDLEIAYHLPEYKAWELKSLSG
jgi:hypothetical protein